MLERPCLIICIGYIFLIIISVITFVGGLFHLADIMDLEAYAVFGDKMVVDHDRLMLIEEAMEEQKEEEERDGWQSMPVRM